MAVGVCVRKTVVTPRVAEVRDTIIHAVDGVVSIRSSRSIAYLQVTCPSLQWAKTSMNGIALRLDSRRGTPPPPMPFSLKGFDPSPHCEHRFSCGSHLFELVISSGGHSLSCWCAICWPIHDHPTTLVRSITWDQGTEMARHKKFTVDTGVQVNFCDPNSLGNVGRTRT